LSTLMAALYVVWLRRETVRHAYDEFLQQFLSARLATAGSWCLLIFPFVSGLGLALPTTFTLGAAWPSLRKSERAIFLLLFLILVSLPLAYASVAPLCV